MQQCGQALHGRHPGGIGIGPKRHCPPRQGLPVGLGDRLGAVGPAQHHMLREQASGGIGGALPFHHQHLCFWSLAQAR